MLPTSPADSLWQPRTYLPLPAMLPWPFRRDSKAVRSTLPQARWPALIYWCTIQLKWIGAGILVLARMRHDVVEPRSHHPQPETHGTEKFLPKYNQSNNMKNLTAIALMSAAIACAGTDRLLNAPCRTSRRLQEVRHRTAPFSLHDAHRHGAEQNQPYLLDVRPHHLRRRDSCRSDREARNHRPPQGRILP